MAQVVVEFAAAPVNHLQVVAAKGHLVQELTSGLSSTATTIEARVGDVAVISNNGAEDVWVSFGATPTAAVGSGHFVMAGTVREFGGLEDGDKCAAINDA